MAPDSATLSSSKTAGQKVAHGRIAEPVLVKGRRDFFTYRDLGVAEGSAGTMRAQVMTSSQGLSHAPDSNPRLPAGWVVRLVTAAPAPTRGYRRFTWPSLSQEETCPEP